MSDEQVRTATGRSLAQWTEELDAEGLGGAPPAKVVAHLTQRLRIPRVWAEVIARAFGDAAAERPAKERRGDESKGLEETVDLPAGEVWKRLAGADSCQRWLGTDKLVVLAVGEEVDLKDGTHIRISAVQRPWVLRLDWRDPTWDDPCTVRLELEAEGAHCTRLVFYVEEAPDEEEAEWVRGRLRRRLVSLVVGLDATEG